MTTLLLDDFNRADAGALGAPSVGPSPTYQDGSWEISSNQAKPDNSGSETLVWWDIGATTYTLEATLATKAHTSGTLLNCIMFRGDGGTEPGGTYWIAQANGASASWDLYRRNAGSGWTGPISGGPTVADGQVITVIVTPTLIDFYVNSTLYISSTDATYASNTQVGFRGYADTVRWDDISVIAPDPVPFDHKPQRSFRSIAAQQNSRR